MFSNFSYELKVLLKNAKNEMNELRHSYIGTEHLLLAILKSNTELKSILNEYNITYDIIKNKIINNIGFGCEKENLFVLTPLFRKILEESIIIANELKLDEVNSLIVFRSILEEAEGVAYRLLCELNIDIDLLYDSLFSYQISNKNNVFSEYGVDLTEKAKNGLTDIAVGREKEIDSIIGILLRKNKKNPILIGPAGVGKTAIIEELANRIINSNVPDKLLNKRIISVSMASLVAGTKYRGEFEEKILKILDSLESNSNYILFIDEIHTLAGAGGAEGAIDASNILKPALSRGNITVIGATTTEEYRKYIENDKALSRRFQPVIINEPNGKELLTILKKVKESYEYYHNVKINNDLLKYLIKVSNKYCGNKKEPDRSIDLLDETLSMVSSKKDDIDNYINKLKEKLIKYKNKKNEMIVNNNYNDALKYRKKERNIESIINNSNFNKTKNNEVTKDDINLLISKKYNIIFGNFNVLECEFANKKKRLISEFKDNKNEIEIIYDCIRNIFDCDFKKRKPVSIQLSGNNTSIRNIISKISEMFFSNKIVLDLKNYSSDESISMIFGAFPGYIGYNNKSGVFESLKEQPFSLIIISNYDKACIKVKNIIKDILKTGYLKEFNGDIINFLNSLIILNINNMDYNPIGFNNKNRNNKSDLSEYVNKTIIINKNKISML